MTSRLPVASCRPSDAQNAPASPMRFAFSDSERGGGEDLSRSESSGVLSVHDLAADPGEPDRGMSMAVLRLVVLGKLGGAALLGADAAFVESLRRSGHALDGGPSNDVCHFSGPPCP